jgi:hypothetical protein
LGDAEPRYRVDEVIRNFFIRQPVLWLALPGDQRRVLFPARGR